MFQDPSQSVLAFDGAPRQQRSFLVFFLRVKDAGAGYEHFRQVGRERSGTVARGQPPFNPIRVLLANLEDEPAQVSDPGVCKSEIWIQLDGLLEHLQGVVHILAARVASSAQVEIICLRIFRGLAAMVFSSCGVSVMRRAWAMLRAISSWMANTSSSCRS